MKQETKSTFIPKLGNLIKNIYTFNQSIYPKYSIYIFSPMDRSVSLYENSSEWLDRLDS